MSRIGLLVVGIVLLAESRASAQEIRWRHDLASARREAAETGKPLLLDFGTEACVWCRKLDATTFRDPRVVKLVNDQFIAVKVDGDQESKLVSALGIDAYPTIVVAGPDGKIVARNPGYADRSQVLALLAKAPPPIAKAPVARQPAAALAGAVKPRTEYEDWRQSMLKVDADLTALFPAIAAGLAR